VKIEGDREVLSALKGGVNIYKIFIRTGNKSPLLNDIISLAREYSIPIKYLDKEQWKRRGFMSSSGICATISEVVIRSLDVILKSGKKNTEQGKQHSGEGFTPPPEKKGHDTFWHAQKIAFLDRITDVRNLGSIIRSGVAFGIKHYIVPSDEIASINDVVVSVSQGAIFHAFIYRTSRPYTVLSELKNMGYNIVCVCERGLIPIHEYEWQTPFIVVFGSENKGIRNSILEIASHTVSIPVDDIVGSLNVGVAAGIVFHYIHKYFNQTPSF